jgi:hypothetical protein
MEWIEVLGILVGIFFFVILLPERLTFKRWKIFVFNTPILFTALLVVLGFWMFFGYHRENIILMLINAISFVGYCYLAHKFILRSMWKL